MTTFHDYAKHFELHRKDGEAARHVGPLFSELGRIDFAFRMDDTRADDIVRIRSRITNRRGKIYERSLTANN